MPSDLRRPALILLDVNETLSDMSPLGRRFEEVGAPAHLAATWFAGVLRDGFGLTAAGATAPLAEIATESLALLLEPVDLDRATSAAVDHVMTGFGSLGVHPDVRDGLPALAALGIRLVTLGNGGVAVADGLLERSGLTAYVERTLSVDEIGVWKPAARPYVWAIEQLGVPAGDAMLVAVHPWDVDGARRAGLPAAWVDRPTDGRGSRWPSYLTEPTLQVASFTELAEVLT